MFITEQIWWAYSAFVFVAAIFMVVFALRVRDREE